MADVLPLLCFQIMFAGKGGFFMAIKGASEAQRVFARAIVLEGMSKSDAFRKA